MNELDQSIRKRQWFGLLLVCLAASLPFVLLYGVSKRSMIQEVRSHVMGVAIAAAQGIPVSGINDIHDPSHVANASYIRIQEFLDGVALANPDVRYIYTMRKSRDPLSPAWMMEYIVDQPARDFNRDGVIDASERSELPGNPYDASRTPELVQAFYEPSADYQLTADPPYPSVISGYAPVHDEQGKVVGIVGVDITAATIDRKLLAIQVVMVLVWAVICLLLSLVYLLYQRKRFALARISKLSHELSIRNDMLRSANQQLAAMNHRFEEDLRLAQKVQHGFLPKRFPRRDRIVFDQYYLTCEILGGDLYDVFEIDHDHVGIYMADVAGHGVSAALVSGLLKMAVSTLRQQKPDSTSSMFIDLTQPEQFLRSINELLVDEVPEGEFITLIYCVCDLMKNEMVMASAGHPHPLMYRRETRTAAWCRTENGMALGIEKGRTYVSTRHPLQSGDLVTFYTDGLTEAMNVSRDEYGEQQLLAVVEESNARDAAELNGLIKSSVEAHRAGCDVSDDFTLLTVEFR